MFSDKYAVEKFKELLTEFGVKTIVETGTCKAVSTVKFAEFANTISIEIVREHFEEAKARFLREGYKLGGDSDNKAWLIKDEREVTLYCGNSPEVIRRIIEELEEPIFFYLDAHWLEYWPLKDEIRAIKPRPNSLITIHDFKVPGKDFGYDIWPLGPCAYETIKDDLAYVNPNYRVFYNEKAAGNYRGILYAVPSKETARSEEMVKLNLDRLMKPKISVITVICRPGYIDTLVEALRNQTFKDFEWILVDDLWEQRKEILKEYVGDFLNLKHIPPREITPYVAGGLALNTGIIHAEGELVYFMNDYIYPHPRDLERHWEIYSKYGPKVLISGPLIDAIVASGKSVVTGAPPIPLKIRNDEGNIATYPELTPPIPWELKDNYEDPTPENLISIWKRPFKPTWPKTFPPDWRLGHISKVSIDKNLCENDNPNWFWAGRNDSAPLEALLDINGFDEAFDGRGGGTDADLGGRLMKCGCKYLVDREAPCYMLPHLVKKRVNISEEDRLKRIVEKRKVQPIPNDYSLRAERAKIGRDRAEGKKGELVSKILCISTAIYPLSSELRYGGIERLCYIISSELNRRGFAVSVAAPDGSSFPEGITHINTGPCGDFIEGEKNAYQHYGHLLGESDAVISFDHRHFAMLERDLPGIALTWHTPSIMQFPLPSYNIASLSEFQKRELEQYQGLKSRVIDPHCVDSTAYLPHENDSGRYLFIGRLNPEKGVRDAIKLCRELGVGLDIIGGLAVGDPSEYLEWVEGNCDPEQIVYQGNVSDKVKFEFIAKAKALLHTVNYPEVSSYKSIEAMCGGLPVIAYDIGANGEIIEHEVAGFIARDENDFKKCMAKAGDLNKDLIRERALKRWSVEATVDHFIPVLKEVAGGVRW